MGKLCPSCNQAELEELVPGIMQCPSCKKVFKGEEQESEEEGSKQGDDLIDGDYWMKNTSLNPKYEVADKGMTVYREQGKYWIAVLLCHSSFLKDLKYMRISWFKQSINKHGGMFKIQEMDELKNVIIALERIDNYFDENFQLQKKITFKAIPNRSEAEYEELFDEKTKMCPNCKKTQMKRSRNKKYYECIRCGEIIVLQDGKPIYNIPNENLPLSFSSEYPVNYYIPDFGITTHYHIANWKAIIVIHAKENPDKKWLRFYWWERNLQNYIKSNMNFGADGSLKWQAKKGVSSPNIHDKNNIRLLINVLYKMREEWGKEKGIHLEEIEIPEE